MTMSNAAVALTVVSDIDADFAEWYSKYPRKVAPDAAKRAYRAARKRGASKADLLAGRDAYVKDCKASNRDKRYIAHPATWLNGSRWLDEYEEKEEFSEPWPQRMAGWHKSRLWVPMWGPRPGERGCRVPRSLLKQDGEGR